MDLKQVGLRIKQCRRGKNLTQEKFAEMIDVSPHYVYEIERGLKAMSIHTLHKIVTGLNVSADYILYGDNAPQNAPSYKKPSDSLEILTQNIPDTKRENIAEIISFLLPYLK